MAAENCCSGQRAEAARAEVARVHDEVIDPVCGMNVDPGSTPHKHKTEEGISSQWAPSSSAGICSSRGSPLSFSWLWPPPSCCGRAGLSSSAAGHRVVLGSRAAPGPIFNSVLPAEGAEKSRTLRPVSSGEAFSDYRRQSGKAQNCAISRAAFPLFSKYLD